MSFNLLLEGRRVIVIIDNEGEYSNFYDVVDVVIKKNERLVLDEVVIRRDEKDYLIPDGLNKILKREEFSAVFNQEIIDSQNDDVKYKNNKIDEDIKSKNSSYYEAIKSARNMDDWDSLPKAVYERALSEIILTSSMFVANKDIENEIDFISSECAYGMNIFKDLFASVRDFIGGRSKAVENTLKDAKITVLDELRINALKKGADAVISIDLKYIELGAGSKNGMLLVVATGTAVKLD